MQRWYAELHSYFQIGFFFITKHSLMITVCVEKTNLEMVMICPDCPSMTALNSPEAMRAVDETVKRFNQNTSNQHYYILQEAGRVLTGV